MGDSFIRIMRPVVKTAYRLIKTSKKTYRKLFSLVKPGKTAVAFRADGSNAEARSRRQSYRAKNRPVWKDKRFIASTCAVVVIVTVVLSIVLPNKDNTAEAAAAALVNAVQPSVSPSASAGESPSATASYPQTPSPEVSDTIDASSSDGAAIQPLSAVTDDPISTTPPEASPVPTTAPDIPDLVPGCNDPRILEVQTRLMELGYMGEEEPTDYYGYGTEYALQLFQRKHSLQVDGLLGEKTLAALFSDEATPYTVKLGDRGTDVEGIQERLQELKYLKAGSTGYFGTDTETAVKNFQKRNGLTVDGNVGENTREVLYSDDAKVAKTPSSSGNSGKNGNSSSNSGNSGNSGSSGNSGGNSGGNESSAPPPASPDEASASALIEYAKTLLGTKYVRGGKNANGFDCSGFVYYSLNQVGYKIKYMTSAGWAKSGLPKVENMSDLQKGDIVCFKGHVGIYMGDGLMIDASSSAGKIRITSNIFNSSYWKRTFICGRRVF